MRILATIAALLAGLLGLARGGETEFKLAPNARLRWEVPDAPPTLRAQLSGKPQVAIVTAILPDNYSAEGRFPLFVFLQGGDGGTGERAEAARSIVGARDFIAVNLPLFKNPSASPRGSLPGLGALSSLAKLVITPADAPLLGSAFERLLGKLLQAVPNVAVERSVLGGFSNGAHATAALMTGSPFARQHFRGYVLLEGGAALFLDPAALQNPELHDSRFLLLFGDQPPNDAGRIFVGQLLLAVQQSAAQRGLDFRLIAMRGHGHEQPPEYLRLIGAWARGEPLPSVP